MFNVTLIVSIPSSSNGFYPVNLSFELPMVIDDVHREKFENKMKNILVSELYDVFYSQGLIDENDRWCYKNV